MSSMAICSKGRVTDCEARSAHPNPRLTGNQARLLSKGVCGPGSKKTQQLVASADRFGSASRRLLLTEMDAVFSAECTPAKGHFCRSENRTEGSHCGVSGLLGSRPCSLEPRFFAGTSCHAIQKSEGTQEENLTQFGPGGMEPFPGVS